MLIRGIRNKNPLNIEKGSKWVGLVEPGQDNRFCEFEDFYYGYRAAFKILLGAYRERGWNTISSIIEHWAPMSENNVTNYIRAVCNSTGFKFDKVLHRYDYVAVVLAMAKVECGSIPSISDCLRAGYEQCAEITIVSHLLKNS